MEMLNVRTEKGVILIVFKKPSRSPRFALLKRTKNWEGWEVPKGHLEDDDFRETVKLELREETGIEEDEIKEIQDIESSVEWSYKDDGEEVEKKYRAYIVEVEDSALVDTDENPHDEHEKGHFLNYNDAHTLLTYEDQKKLLEQARDIIEEND